jgi:hypothetical protein
MALCRGAGADALLFQDFSQGQLGCVGDLSENRVFRTRRHAQRVNELPRTDTRAGEVQYGGLFSNLEAFSLYSGFCVELASPAKVYERLAFTAEIAGASVRNKDARIHIISRIRKSLNSIEVRSGGRIDILGISTG